MKTKLVLIALFSFFLLGCTGSRYPFMAELTAPFVGDGDVLNLYRDNNVLSFEVSDVKVSLSGIDFSNLKIIPDYVRIKKTEKPFNVSTVIDVYNDDELIMVYADNIEPGVTFMGRFRMDAGSDLNTSMSVEEGYKWVNANLIDEFNNVISLTPGIIKKIDHNGEVWNFLLLGAMARSKESSVPIGFTGDLIIYR